MADSYLQRMRRSSHLAGTNAAYIEAMYEAYLAAPESLSPQWRGYFNGLPAAAAAPEVPHSGVVAHFERIGRNRLKARPERESAAVVNEHERKQMRVLGLIAAYRARGHKKAAIDPLGMMERRPMPVLELAYHDLSVADLDEVFNTDFFAYGDGSAKLRDIVAALESFYCGSIGAEYMHITQAAEQLWVQMRLETDRTGRRLSAADKRTVLERLTAAEGLEKYLHGRYPGVKRFGLEGGEALIPCLHELLQRLGAQGVIETVIGMAHRGRLNVLVNILGKDPWDLFAEFDGKAVPELGSGDVKYHQGFSTNVMTPGGEMHLALAFNPSHLEIVGPVVEGSVRARQDRRRDYGGDLVAPILIHGDAAFAGQGVVMETFQMSQTRGFKTGGTVHIVVNNQIGFTTSRQDDARSTEYCTEIAKVVKAPILHVNGDDPEAVAFAAQVAADYRMKFRRDVVIDIVCYRRRGHNEAEEPMKTQPLMYGKIRRHPTARDLYVKQLIEEQAVSAAEADELAERYRSTLERGGHVALSIVQEPDPSLFVDWRPFLGHAWTAAADTRVSKERFMKLAKRLAKLPDGFQLQRQVAKTLAERDEMTRGERPVNWGYAEIMAYATLVDAGHGVRLTGQDVGVGTFSHRHACLYDQRSGKRYIPLNKLSDGVNFDIYDSLLSEEAVLAFEYGYATTTPHEQVIWEAQFGDFANGAQVVVDQFISSGETKWGRLCGLAVLLPHGYEGAGPEHSSARLERFLQLCAEHNMQVCLPSTPAQVFHMLRRQTLRPLRKPLVALTPKSLLRHKQAVSSLAELHDGRFHTVLPDPDGPPPAAVKRLVLCSGKVFYELREARQAAAAEHIAIVRIEQLYPYPEEDLGQVIAPYANLKEAVWCQEEPMNQGAWYASQHHSRRVLQRHDPSLYLNYAGREAFAAPAAGYLHLHQQRQQRLVRDALFGTHE